MEQIIKFFTTENVLLGNILTFPLAAIELCVNYIFIKTIYNLAYDRKLKIIFIIIGSIFSSIIKLTLPMPYSTFLNTFIFIILQMKILNVSLFKALIAQCAINITYLIFEFIVTFFLTKVLYLGYDGGINLAILRIPLSLFIYFGLFIITKFISYFKVNLNSSDQMSKKQKFRILINTILISIILWPNFIFLQFINMDIPIYYIAYNFISAILFFFLGTYNTHENNKQYVTSRELETAKLYNNTLTKLVDANRGFKHDMNNIIQAIGGYIELKDYDGLKEYYDTGLLPEIEKVNNLSLLNPETINSAPIFGLFLGKFNYADSKNVKVNLKSFFDYSTINMNVFDFVKIFGILFDNAIEAASLCEEKIVDIYVSIDFYNRKQVFDIKNTYIDKNIDTEKIFEKDFSTKEKKSGFGLWEVKEILKRYQNTKLHTTKTDKLFCQKLEIFF